MKETGLKGKLYRNASITLFSQLLRLLLQFLLQKAFINSLGMEYLGYNSVFKNILQMLNMADLGVGVAITGFLYAPLAGGDKKRVSALMHIYKNVYHGIGVVVSILGFVLMLFLPIIIPDASCTYAYLRMLFMINLIGIVSSYFLAYKRTLLIANQMSYYTSTIDLLTDIIGTVLQIIGLFCLRSYVLYLILNINKTIMANIIISIRYNKKYGYFVKEVDGKLVQEYKEPLTKYVKDVFISKIGGFVYSGTDNIVISIFKGSLLAGYLSNYTLVSVGLKSIITQILSSVQATYGNYVVTEKDTGKQLGMTDAYIYVDYVVANICMICCIILYQPFVSLYVGKQYLLDYSTPVLISVNLYLAIILIIPSQVFSVFRLFKYDKYIIMVSATLNIVISSALVIYIGVNGVLIGTTITSLIYLFSRLYIMAKRVFQIGILHYVKKILTYLIISTISLFMSLGLVYQIDVNHWISFMILALGVACFSIVITIFLSFWMHEHKYLLGHILPMNNKVYIMLISILVIICVICIGGLKLAD